MNAKDIMYALEAEGVQMQHEYQTGTFQGRHIRVNCNLTVDIGESDFDKWGNSIAASFTPMKKRAFTRQFRRACLDAGIPVT